MSNQSGMPRKRVRPENDPTGRKETAELPEASSADQSRLETENSLKPEKWYELMNERYQLLADLSIKGESWNGVSREDKPKGFDAVARLKKRLYKIEGQLNEIRLGGKQELAEFYQAVDDEERFSLMFDKISSLKGEREELLSAEYAIVSDGKKNPRGLNKADREALLEIREEQEAVAQKQEFLENSPETAIYFRMATLEDYRRNLQGRSFVETPSRQALEERIKFHIENGEPILLEGETGTGKTELALNLCRKLYGREPEFISGSPDVRASDIFAKQGLKASETASKEKREELAREIADHVEKYKESHPDATEMDIARENDNYARIVAAAAGVTPETYFVYGPLVRAMEAGVPLVIDEANLIETRLRMILKRIYNVKPGQEVPVAGDGTVTVAPGFSLIFTANLKGEKHAERFDFDEAEKRTMINSTIHVGYLPPHELYDLCLAKSMDSDGSAPLSAREAEATLKSFCDAVADIQSAYADRPSEVYAPKDARGKQQEFKEGVLDPGAALRMLNGLEAKSPQEPLADFLNRSIFNYVSNRNYNPKDRELIAKVFLAKGFLQETAAAELEIPGLNEKALQPFRQKNKGMEEPAQNKELGRKSLALLDPYGLRRLANQKIGDSFLDLAPKPETAGVGKPENAELSGEFVFNVKNAINPYAEALKEGGITDPDLIAERKDITVDLKQLFKDDRFAYLGASLREWTKNMPQDIEGLALTQEQIETIKSRVEQGEIPIAMPGRLAQLKGLTEAIASLKPELIKEGQKQNVADTHHWDYIDQLIPIMIQIAERIKSNGSLTAEDILGLQEQLEPLVKEGTKALSLLESAVRSIPEEPYIFTTKSSQYNDARTRNKNLADQRSELEAIKVLNPEIWIDCLSIGEYLALQNRFTNRVADPSLQELIPLDDYSRTNGTFSRFINLPVSSDGDVPYGSWNSVISQVSLGGNDEGARSIGGFRVSVRV